MEELDIKELINYFWTKKIYILLLMIITLIIGVTYTLFIQKPLYSSYTTILLTKEGDSITSSDIALNNQLINTYSEIIKSKKVLSRVINNLDLDYTTGELANQISVVSIGDTDIIKISVSNADSELAMNIANETASVFNSQIVKLYNIQNLGIIDEAEESKEPYNVNVLKQLCIFTIIGLVLGIGIIFVIYYFDNTIKSSEEIERKLGLPVIGSIPATGGMRRE